MVSIPSVHGDVTLGSVLTWSKRYSDDEVRGFAVLAEQSPEPLPEHLPYLLVIAPLTKLGGDLNYISGGMSWTSARPVSRAEMLTAELEVTRLEPAQKVVKVGFNARIRSNSEVVAEGRSKGVILAHNPVFAETQEPGARSGLAGRTSNGVSGTQRISTGTTLSATRVITGDDIDTCAELTGDFGAHHATGTVDGKMAQGLLTLVSTPLLGAPDVHITEFSLSFLAPVFADNTITSVVEINEITDLGDGFASFAFTVSVLNDGGREVIQGRGSALIGAEFTEAGARTGYE